MTHKNVAQIANRNDSLRAMIPLIAMPNTLVLTRGVAALLSSDVAEIMGRVKMFNDFNEGNDPWGERDFEAFKHNGRKFFWKIDDYQGTDGFDLVLTVMLASEY